MFVRTLWSQATEPGWGRVKQEIKIYFKDVSWLLAPKDKNTAEDRQESKVLYLFSLLLSGHRRLSLRKLPNEGNLEDGEAELKSRKNIAERLSQSSDELHLLRDIFIYVILKVPQFMFIISLITTKSILTNTDPIVLQEIILFSYICTALDSQRTDTEFFSCVLLKSI